MWADAYKWRRVGAGQLCVLALAGCAAPTQLDLAPQAEAVAAVTCDPKECAKSAGTCVAGACVECESNAVCEQQHGAGAKCERGQCRFIVECKAAVDCGVGYTCERHRCVTAAIEVTRVQQAASTSAMLCGSNDDCAKGLLCERNLCVAPPAPKIPDECEAAHATVRFATSDAQLATSEGDLLTTMVSCANADASRALLVEGHSDNRGAKKMNYALARQRALSVLAVLKGRGVDRARVRVTSKGEIEPLCREATPKCMARNRRVEVTLLHNGKDAP